MSITDSRFNMWRAVTAMIHADKVVRPHEIHFILENIRRLPLSEAQMEILMTDLQVSRPVELSFRQITTPKDREDFFYLARSIAWADGDFDEREKEWLDEIRALPVNGTERAQMEKAIRHSTAREIEEHTKPDQPFVSMIRDILGGKAPA